MKVKMIWSEIVLREEILEVDSLEEAHETKISLGAGDVVLVQLNPSYDIQHIVKKEDEQLLNIEENKDE